MQQPNNDKKPGLSWSTPTPSAATPKVQPAKQDGSTATLLPKTTATTNSNLTARYAGIFVGGLIVGVVFAWGYSSITHRTTNSTDTVAAANSTSSSTKATAIATPKSTAKPATAPTTAVASGVVLDNTSPFSITSTQAAGQSVKVDNVEVTKPTWVVVYDNNNGAPGNVLGAQLFFTTSGGTVTLLRPTIAGKTYLVGRAIDNGDRKFQKATDKAVLDEGGNPVLATFTAK